MHSGSGSAVLCGGSAARGKAPGGLSRGRVRARRGGPPRVPRSAVIIPTSPARAPPTHQHRPDPHRHNPQVGVMGFAPGVMHVEEVSVAVVHQGARVPVEDAAGVDVGGGAAVGVHRGSGTRWRPRARRSGHRRRAPGCLVGVEHPRRSAAARGSEAGMVSSIRRAARARTRAQNTGRDVPPRARNASAPRRGPPAG